MPFGPIFDRGLLTMVRRRGAFQGRSGAVIAVVAAIAACVVAWDWKGWDRATVAGASRFALTTFGLFVAVQTVGAIALVPVVVAPSIASERDRKSLDALLTTRLRSGEIVLGATASGLVRYAIGPVGALPVLALMMSLGGVDLRLVLLAVAGLASAVLFVASLSMAASVASRTARQATAGALALVLMWIYVPMLLMMVLPRIWPAAGPWVVPWALWLLDSNPLGVMMNLGGVVRRASFVGSILRMIALQSAGSACLLAWSTWQLRPASRALYDADGRAWLLRSLRVRRRSRPPCGDDPVLWNEVQTVRPMNTAALVVAWLSCAISLVFLVYVTAWFAVPAFKELAGRGYGPAPVGKAALSNNPFARMLVVKVTGTAMDLEPGQARLEFNVAMREATASLLMVYVLVVAGMAAEGIASEKERGTWTGLLATPLSGWDILRAKMLGAAWRARVLPATIVGVWTVALAAGALHPVGFLAGLVGLASSSWMLIAIGTYSSLWARDRQKATNGPVLTGLVMVMAWLAPVFLSTGPASVLGGALSPPFVAWASLLSYEDVRDAARPGPFSAFTAGNYLFQHSAGAMLATVLIGWAVTIALAAAFTRAAVAGFDRAAGRPRRARGVGR